MTTPDAFMRRCFQLALKGNGHTAPNPMVGAVLVHENKIVAEGFHQKCGGPHAEVEAIRSLTDKDLLPTSTLYVSLEPCCHHGKTPPCTDLILSSKIPEVVLACRDPFEAVDGKGEEKLRAAGVKVTAGLLNDEGEFINRRFFTFHRKERPYIILKWAQSADGFIAPETPQPYWISSNESRVLVHKWRTEESAIMVGYRTALLDDPQLTTRLVSGKSPLRIVYDRDNSLPRTHQIFKPIDNKGASTIVFNSTFEQTGTEIEYRKVSSSKNYLSSVLDTLYQKNKLSLMVEGGTATLTHFFENDLWDEVRVIVSEKKLGAGLRAPPLPQIPYSEEKVATDRVMIGYRK